MKLLTSFSPSRIEAQLKAFETWKNHPFWVEAIQCHTETYALDILSDITWVMPNRWWSKKTPSIVDMIDVKEPALLVNSDIEIRTFNQELWQPEPNVLKIGLRTDYNDKNQQVNKYGIDIFLLLPEMKELLVNPIWALGIPGWDYWFVWKLHQSGYKIKPITEGIFHEDHKEQWDVTDHQRCLKLLEFEFNQSVESISQGLLDLTDRRYLSSRRLRK